MRPDTCSFCRGCLRPNETEFVAHVGSQVIVIKNVPARICENCGEAYFTSEISKKIDIIMKQFHEGKILARPLAAGEISLNAVFTQTG